MKSDAETRPSTVILPEEWRGPARNPITSNGHWSCGIADSPPAADGPAARGDPPRFTLPVGARLLQSGRARRGGNAEGARRRVLIRRPLHRIKKILLLEFDGIDFIE